MMPGTPLAEAFVRVRALTDKFKDDVQKGFEGVGDDFGKQFARDASARLKAERGVFEDEGEQIGDKAGAAAGREFADRMKDSGVKFGDDASPFVAVGKKLGEQVGKAAGAEFAKHMSKEAGAGFSQALDPIAKFKLQLAQAELAARRMGLAAKEAAERAEAASKKAAEAAEQVTKGELSKEEATRLAAQAAREQEKAEIAATNAALAKAKVSERAAQVSQAYAKAQADASRETDKLSAAVRSRLNPDLDRSGSVMSGLLGISKSLSGAFASAASSLSLVGAGAAGVAGLGAAAASAAGFVVALAAELAPLGGLLAALPGVALSGAAAFGVWKLATGGLGEAMGAALSGDAKKLEQALGKLSESGRAFIGEFQQAIPLLQGFKAAAQDAFLEPLLGQMGRWLSSANALQPAIAGLAREFGGMVRTVLDFATADRTIGQFNTVIGNTRTLVGALHSALEPLLRGFVDLGTVGSSWLASLSGGLTDSLNRFGAWMSRISAGGQAWAWMDGALAVLKQLGGLAKDLWDIFDGMLDAARTAGGDALGVLGQLADAFATWVKSAEGQDTLVAIFKALSEVGRALLPVLSALGGAVAAIAPEAAKVATALGPVLADAIKALGAGIAALGPGLVRMVEGFGRMVAAIGPLDPLGRALGDVFAALGDALALIIPQVAQIALALAPALTAAVRALGPALAALGPGLTAVAEYLGRAFADPAMQRGLLQLGKGISDVLVAAAPLLPVIAQLAGILAQTLGGALTNLGAALGPIITALGAALEPALRSISDALNIMIPLMAPIYQAFGEIGAALISQLLPPVLNLIPALINGLIPAFAELARQVQPMIPLLTDLAVQLIQQVLPAILPILPELTQLSLEFTRLGLVVAQIVASFAPLIEHAIAIFQHLYDVLVGHSIIPDLINAMTTWFRNGVTWIKDIVSWFGTLPNLIGGWLGSVLSQVTSAWNNIRNAVSERVDNIRQTISGTLNAISGNWQQAWDGARNFVSGAWNNIRNAVGSGISSVLGTVAALPGQIQRALGDLGGLLYNSGRSIMQGLINGLYSMWQAAYNAASEILNHIRNLFPSSPAKEGPFSGKGWTLFSGRSMMTGLADGIAEQQAAVTGALDGVLSAGAATLGAGLQVPLAAMAGPTGAPDFAGSFGGPVGASPVAAAGARVFNVENLIVQGVLDPSSPVSYRRMVERLREAIRELEKEEYANG
ncbi:phage tail protein [Nonomuraea roseoviolacea]|uniref:Phage-related protein/polyhydroxyalkanoate synthesis regulator phasin n=1 Tax=Nonomuraea roseoviolacea subsp. carminata TaxID=160689 RepID=A0ABT1K9B6_9ACTN|nr:hypothetical protein [Nonomuraea roseoviolacea]MCP2350612.1 phage-related protein/polyhydroxyalkanoate synthesis regulator phasin [Nonomuraea roseoviolacea subsp. carminata]